MSKLWGGRFSKETNKLVEEFSKSIHYDNRLAKYDIWSSIIHVGALFKSGYLLKDEAKSLILGLGEIEKELDGNKFVYDPDCEDIHTDIQNKLKNKLKDKGLEDLVLKLHTARSRNDQVVFATKFYCKIKIGEIKKEIRELVHAINTLAKGNEQLIIPGFTHLQHAQPVRLKDYLWAYIEMLKRDTVRLGYIADNLKITMGAGALAGTPLDPNYDKGMEEFLAGERISAVLKKFKVEALSNSLDAVSDRDFIIEILAALSIVAMHLSRLSEDLILWTTKEFDFIELDEAFCTGSSLMPQKKNPDVLELVRGYTGRLYGNLVSVLTMMKGLPLTYNRDMQLDKEPLFNSFEIVSNELKVLAGLIATIKFNKEKIEEHLKDESLYATDLVYYLVRKGVPFKQAHTIIGELVSYSIDNGIPIKEIPEDVLKEKFSDKIAKEEFNKLFNAQQSVDSKTSISRNYDLSVFEELQ